MAVVGGAKVSTKLAVLANLIRRVDRLVIGGAMANTFLHAQGVGVGASLHEPTWRRTRVTSWGRQRVPGARSSCRWTWW